MNQYRAALFWTAVVVSVGVPIALAATSPLHAWRSAPYVIGSFAGIIALCLMLAQPLLIGGYLPGLSGYRARRAHRWIGSALVGSIVIHVGGLGIASPPDMIDALTFTSPTPFSSWGVIAMWAIFAVAMLAAFRQRLSLTPWNWCRAHMALAALIIVASLAHGLLIEGTMEIMSKVALSALLVIVAAKVMANSRMWRKPGK